MNLVITMAGLGSRFRKAGYTMPKYMIPVCGKTLFDWSMISLHEFAESVSRFYFIVRKEDKARTFIEQHCKAFHLSDIQIIELDRETKGQAESVMMAQPYWDVKEPLLVYNIDTYIEAGEMKPLQMKGDGFIPCFRAEGDHWSFVRLDESGQVAEICEKQRISDYCTVGAYYFKTARLYEQLYQKLYEEENFLETGERYIAPMYDWLLKQGGKVYISEISPEKVHVLGTPEELAVFKQKTEERTC